MSRNSSSKAPRDEPGLNPKPKSWGGCDMDGPPSSSSSSHAAPPNSGSRGLRDRGSETPGQPGATRGRPGLPGQLELERRTGSVRVGPVGPRGRAGSRLPAPSREPEEATKHVVETHPPPGPAPRSRRCARVALPPSAAAVKPRRVSRSAAAEGPSRVPSGPRRGSPETSMGRSRPHLTAPALGPLSRPHELPTPGSVCRGIPAGTGAAATGRGGLAGYRAPSRDTSTPTALLCAPS